MGQSRSYELHGEKMTLLDLRTAANVNSPDSLANRLRNARFAVFADLANRLPKPIKILDIGGTAEYWRQRGWAGLDGVGITVVNLDVEPSEQKNISVRAGNATDLREFPDQSFDIAYSNSVIEHLSSIQNQEAMAREVRRVAKCYWVQTPNFWFPIEPHYHVPGWQWMPRSLRIRLLMGRRCGWRGPVTDRTVAEDLVDEVRLMTTRELSDLFPGAQLWRERFIGLTKSLVVHGGFPARGKGGL